ncbi:hypothetical protein V6N11_017831 [Hibiscus sabdariffa]|uniref:NB-ARC domain-containing protein n=1 Tax=Hibiscus sabdariffa TaxID=183260 RepID=A0ABR2T5K2_9ROSI
MLKCKISGGRIGESNALTCGFHTEDVLRSTREVEQLITQHTKFHGGECFLEIIGIPEPSVGSKLLLTTRSSDVCRQVGCRVIKVKPLMKEEAWKLFLEKVGHDILNIPGWNQLQSFAEGGLIQLWIAEGLVEEIDSIQAEFDRGRAIMNGLINNCLLELFTKSDNRRLVKMHDLLRDMALHIAKSRFLVKAVTMLRKLPDVQEWNKDLEKVSFMNNREMYIPSEMSAPKCPRSL